MRFVKIIVLGCCSIGALIALSACGGGGGGSSSSTTTSTVKVYVIGASYSADGTKVGTDDNNISGDARYVNGPIGEGLWVERYATAISALTPVSNTRTASSGQSATNYARGGSYALGDSTFIATSTATASSPQTQPTSLICDPSYANTGGADCGLWNTTPTKYPANAYDQWLLIKNALGSTAPGTSDVLTIDTGGNDLINYHSKVVRSAAAGDPFVSNRADVIEKIAQEAATQGFKKIVIAKIPPIDQLTGVVNLGWSGLRLGYLQTDVSALNTKIVAKITTATTGLKAVNPSVSFYVADWHTAITNALATPSLAGVTSSTSDAGNRTTAESATYDAFWWDANKKHPSAKVHKYMADNFITLQ